MAPDKCLHWREVPVAPALQRAPVRRRLRSLRERLLGSPQRYVVRGGPRRRDGVGGARAPRGGGGARARARDRGGGAPPVAVRAGARLPPVAGAEEACQGRGGAQEADSGAVQVALRCQRPGWRLQLAPVLGVLGA